jgi:hypothetical protein
MRRLILLVVLFACHHEEEDPGKGPRPAVPPVWAVGQTNRTPPDPACTCATPESSPAPSPWDKECDERFAVCGSVHYPEFIGRTNAKGLDAMEKLLALHFVESQIYDATIELPAPKNPAYADHDAQMRVHRGDIIPTPRGRARVVQIYPPTQNGTDDGYVRFRLLDAFAFENSRLLFVSSGGPSQLDGEALTLVRADGNEADLVHSGASLHVKKGDRIKTARGSYPIIEIVNGKIDGALGWVTIDTGI